MNTFKKGQEVAFSGTDAHRALNKTYIHAVLNSDDPACTKYIIQHPQGVSKEHIWHEEIATQLKPGILYIVALPELLTALPVSIDKPTTDNDPGPEQTITMHKAIWDAVVGSLMSQYMTFKNQKIMVKMQASLSEEDYQHILINMEHGLRHFHKEGLIENLEELGIK